MVRKSIFMLGILISIAPLTFSQSVNGSNAETQTSALLVPTERQISLIEGKVISVHTGDTFSIRTKDRTIHTIWLQATDAPEEGQDFGKKSRKNLEELIQDKEVKVVVNKQDEYGRYIGTAYLRGRDIGLLQVEWGMAWHFKRFGYEQAAESRKLYAQAEANARSARQGLWKDSDPTAPWDYRAEHEKKAGKRSEPVELRAVSQGINREAAQPKAVPNNAAATVSEHSKSEPSNAAATQTGGKKYILGPRGGCYYLSESGRKVYVKDKGLCAENQSSSKQP